MLLENTMIDTRLKNSLAKRNIYSVDAFLRMFPRLYYDFRELHTIKESINKMSAVRGTLISVKKKPTSNNTSMVQATIEDADGNKVNASWFGHSELKGLLDRWLKQQVVICGVVEYHYTYGYLMNQPTHYSLAETFPRKIFTVYSDYSGISDEKLRSNIKAFAELPIADVLPKEIIARYKLMDYQTCIRALHFPSSMEDIEKANQRILFQDMLYYASKLEAASRESAVGTPFNIKRMSNVYDYINSLPYEMTADQASSFDSMVANIKEGKRIQALLQGDVGYGKTLVAFLCMLLMAESGYQSALMAPNAVLAKQHFEELQQIGERYGYKTALLVGDLSAKEKKEYIEGIRTGKYLMVVGTTSLIQKNVEYKDLAFVITDEEQKFGVIQRDELTEKASRGVNVLSMSATPVPRTLAMAIYGTQTSVYELRTQPAGRQKTQTAMCRNDESIYKHIENQIAEGRQAYVVCPFITRKEDKKGKTNVMTVEDTFKAYQERFEGTNIVVGMVTGKMKAEERERIFAEFTANKIQILIATTIIEVGVNVPNASVIVINSAERFGLSCLHQLRGRVGRGRHKGYCILRVSDVENSMLCKIKERLQILVDSTNGFDIALEDLKQRKAGDFIGIEQTGKNKYIEEMLENEKLFEVTRKIASWMVDKGLEIPLIEAMEENDGINIRNE